MVLKVYWEPKPPGDRPSDDVNYWTDEVLVTLIENLLRIEVRHAFTARETTKKVLVCVKQGVNALCSELVDHFFDVGQVLKVINAFATLDRLPGDTKSNKVDAPGLQILDIFIGKGGFRIKFVSIGYERINLIDDIDTVEQHVAAMNVTELTVSDVDLLLIHRTG